MRADDLQIGDIWTAEDARGQGISKTVLCRILNDYKDKTIWFLCDASNTASQNLAKAAGLELFAVGTRTLPCGIGVIGRFVIF